MHFEPALFSVSSPSPPRFSHEFARQSWPLPYRIPLPKRHPSPASPSCLEPTRLQRFVYQHCRSIRAHCQHSWYEATCVASQPPLGDIRCMPRSSPRAVSIASRVPLSISHFKIRRSRLHSFEVLAARTTVFSLGGTTAVPFHAMPHTRQRTAPRLLLSCMWVLSARARSPRYWTKAGFTFRAKTFRVSSNSVNRVSVLLP